MNPDELLPGDTYWVIRFGSVTDMIFQCELIRKPESANKGYLFLMDNIKPYIVWASEMSSVFHDQGEALLSLSNYHLDKANQYITAAASASARSREALSGSIACSALSASMGATAVMRACSSVVSSRL